MWSLRQLDATIEVFGKPSGVLAIAAPDTPACLIVDLRLPEMSGLELLRTLRSKGWGMPFVIITGFGDVAGAVEAMQFGALHFLEKPVDEAELVRVVQAAFSQDRERLEKLRLHTEFETKLATLTPRETDVLKAVVAGKLNKQIASDLELSIKTVETHRSNLTRKLEVDSVAQLVRLVVELSASRRELGERA